MHGIIPGWFHIYMDKYMNLLDFLAAPANALVIGAAAPQGLGGFGLLMPIALIAVMYFLMIRPQMKRAKEHRAMLDKLSKGDEVITSGGIAGTVTDIGDNFVTVEIADGVRIRVQKAAVGNVLPKGTLKSA
jgi:preprotein translocase subunit YajC